MINLHTTASHETAASTVKPIADSELVTRSRNGDIAAFEAIMRRYNQRLYRIARSILHDEHEALDVVQETYIKAYYQLQQFRGPDGFASWLSRIATNEAIMRNRKSSRISCSLDDAENPHELESPEPQPLDQLAGQQLRRLMESAIDRLPVEYRSVYVMRAVQGLSTRETALSLGHSEDVVKTRYLRAKRNLHKIFEGHMQRAGLEVYEFAGHRCDAIVQTVIESLKQGQG